MKPGVGFENFLKILIANTYPSVHDFDLKPRGTLIESEFDWDLADVSVLEGIRNQVAKDLLEATFVSFDQVWLGLVKMNHKL